MNKKLAVAILVLVILVTGAVAATVWFVLVRQADDSVLDSKNSHAAQYSAKDACKYLDPDVAEKLLGLEAQKGGGASTGSSTADINVSVCTYSSKISPDAIQDVRHATVLLRSPLTSAGEVSNQAPFDQPKSGSQNVEGYGQKAFWDPELGQLNVLKDHTWAILSLGKTLPQDRTIEETRRLADLIVPKL